MLRNNTGYEFFDSYGFAPDQELEYALYDKVPLLGRLLQAASNRGAKIVYNTKQIQALSRDMNTCGRHVGCRIAFSELSLVEYIDMIQGSKMNFDRFVTILTLIIKH